MKKRVYYLIFAIILTAYFISGCFQRDFEPGASRLQLMRQTPSVPETESIPQPSVTLWDSSEPIYQEHDICIRPIGTENTFFGTDILLSVENGRKQDILVTADLLSANGYMMNASLYATVPAESTAQIPLTLYTSELRKAGISAIKWLEFRFQFLNQENHSSIALSPMIQLGTEDALSAPFPLDAAPVIFAGKAVRIYSGGVHTDDLWSGELVLLLENISEQSITLSLQDLTVDGASYADGVWCTLRPGTRAVASLPIPDADSSHMLQLMLRQISGDSWQLLAPAEEITITVP